MVTEVLGEFEEGCFRLCAKIHADLAVDAGPASRESRSDSPIPRQAAKILARSVAISGVAGCSKGIPVFPLAGA